MHVDLLMVEDRGEPIKEYLQDSVLSFMHFELAFHDFFFVGLVSTLLNAMIVKGGFSLLIRVALVVKNIIQRCYLT